MTFEKFLKHYLTPDDGSLLTLSKFKHEDQTTYEQYRNRARHTEELYQRNASRSLQDGKIPERLTPRNFGKYEELANKIDALTGKNG